MTRTAWIASFLPIALAAALGGSAAAAPGGVVINEVMYHPFNESTFGRYEFIELYNSGNAAVDLGGALLTDSQDLAGICNNVRPADHEGVFRFPANTLVAPGAFLTMWHTVIPGVSDQPGNLVYDHFEFLGNLVLANGGDQVTLLRCEVGGPSVIDALDYSTLGLPAADHNVSIERIDPMAATQSGANWGLCIAPHDGQAPNDGYSHGGTPGAVNSISGQACDGIAEFEGAVGPHLPDVLFMSESDRPFDLVSFPGAGGAPPTGASLLALLSPPPGSTAEERDVNNFYRNIELSGGGADPNAPAIIVGAFNGLLTDVIYVAIHAPPGSPDEPIVNVYLVGRTACGDLVGIHSIAIET